mmetsp:Transcript_82269/g.255480  ORF Transcript_82269/g.255480 Transcript_82269/m.255480 type:complete len:465 (+) Transcript_82269:114-1508(+)
MLAALRDPSRQSHEYVQVGDADSEDDADAFPRGGRPPSARAGLCRRAEQVSETPSFALVAAVVIMLNVLCMALQADYPVWHLKPDCQSHCGNGWHLVNGAFLAFFTVELLMRLSAGYSFFCGRDWSWNCFDLVVVVLTWVVHLCALAGLHVRGGSAVSVLRLFRVLRLVHAVEMVEHLAKLRLLVRGLVESLNVVLWILMLLLGIILIMAIFCTMLIGHNAEEWGDKEEDIRLYFGSFQNSTVTLFQYLTLDDWSNISRLVMEVMPWTLAVFLLYVIVAALVIISLFSGVMADHMNGVREQELVDERKRQQEQLVDAMMVVHEAFRAADATGDHLVTKAEFAAMMRRPHLRAKLASAGVDLSDLEPEELFDCFDEGGHGELSWDEFKAGMEGLREGVTPKQLFKLLAAVRRAVAFEAGPSPSPRRRAPLGRELQRMGARMARAERRLEGLSGELESFLGECGDA